MEANAWRAAEKEPPLPFEEIETMLKECLIDSGVSSEVQVRSGQAVDFDKISALERQVADLQSGNENKNNLFKKAVLNGKELCHKFNSHEGNPGDLFRNVQH